MRIYRYIICIFLISVFRFKSIFSRSLYDSPHYVDREDNAPIIASYSKKKLLKDELAHEATEDIGGEVLDPASSLYDTRFRQYDPAEMYRAPARMLPRANADNALYDLKKREYYPDMKTGRDSSLEVVLDPKARKAVALIDNPSQQDNYDLTGWKKEDTYGFENDPYSQGNQDQVVSLVYPMSHADRLAMRGNVENTGGLEQPTIQNKNLRNAQDCDSQSQLVYKSTLIEPERAEPGTLKAKRHTKIDKKDANEKHDAKHTSESEDAQEGAYENENNMEPDREQNTNNKRSVPNWTNEQIVALKDSLAMLQENSGEFDNVKNILNDMGLIETNPVKRQTDSKENDEYNKEDENMSESDIPIEKNDKKWETNINEAPQEPVKRDADDNKSTENEDTENGTVVKRKMEKVGANKRSGDSGNVISADIEDGTVSDKTDRKKRDSDTNSNSANVKEKAGDVPEAENKAPLVTDEKSDSDIKEELAKATSDKEPIEKRNVSNGEDTEEYEQEIESQIQAKINAIKEKVKREILIQKQQQSQQNSDGNERKKREITLLDGERKSIDPDLLTDEALQPHVRTRRETPEIEKTEKLMDEINERPQTDLNKRQSSKSSTDATITSEEKDKIKAENEDDEATAQHTDQKREACVHLPENKLVRRKRANGMLPENRMVFRPYQAEQDEEDDGEEGEFDNSYDQTYVEKRQAYDPDYQYFERRDVDNSQEFEVPERAQNYLGNLYPEQRYRRSQAGAYIDDLNSDGYDQAVPYNRNHKQRYRSRRFARLKRDNENAQLHGGGMLVSRKSAMKNKDIEGRDKRGNSHNENGEKNDSDNSETDFFGALPQNYEEGELTRYKRVKRDDETKLGDVT